LGGEDQRPRFLSALACSKSKPWKTEGAGSARRLVALGDQDHVA
jgi:hypothetical protein